MKKHELVDVDDRIEIPELKKISKQKWISAHDFIPEMGHYLCITERKCILGENGIGHNFEVCYYNDLMEAFQGHNNELVNVTHWLPISKFPKNIQLAPTNFTRKRK